MVDKVPASQPILNGDRIREIPPASGVRTHRMMPLIFLALSLLSSVISPAYADTASRASAFDYDPVSGLLTKEIVEPDDPNLCMVTTYTYDSFGNKTGATTRNCNGSAGSAPSQNTEAAAPTTSTTAGTDAIITSRTSTTTYDAQGRFPISSSNALSQTETKTFNANYGTPATLTGPNNLTTNWTYDSFGRPLTESRADGTSSSNAYALCDASCPANAKYTVTKTQVGAPSNKSYYDMLGRVIQSETPDKDGTLITIRTEYDKLGRIARTSHPYKAGGSVLWTTVSYDTIGRPVSTTAPDNTTTTVSYNGFTTITTNAKSQTKTEVKNSQGQLVSVTDAASKTLTYIYDAFGNLANTTDAQNNITTITYDKRGRKTSMNDPDQGTWSYTYDVLGQLKSQTDAKLQLVTFQYDVLGRMTSRNEPDLKSSWAYDTCDATLNAGGKCTGKPVKETSDNGYIRTYVYDAFGRPTAEVDNVDTGYGVAKTYDSYGRVDTLAYPNGFSTRNVYSSTGYLTEVRNASSSALYWQANTTDNEGRINQFTYGNGIITNTTYDALGRISQINAGGTTGVDMAYGNRALTATGSTSVTAQSYVYDTVGNITQRYDAVTGLNEGFAYDNLNRLTSTSAQAGSGPLTQTTLTYNSIGNILTKSDVGTYTYGSGTNASGQLVRPHGVTKIMMNDGVTQYAAYTYDANGNMLTGAGRTAAWNSWNMPSSITGTTPAKSTPAGTSSSTFGFVYNSAHERVKETLPDGTVVYNISPRVDVGIHVEKRVKTDGTIQYVNSLYAGSFPFGTVTVTSKTGTTTTTKGNYFHTDHLGSLVAISDDAGNVTERRSYDAWGKKRNLNGTSMNNAFVTPQERHGFTGHEELDEVGLVNMNGRIYDPAIGRFMSADSSIQYPSDMQSYNRYSYINNNPLSANDPSGHGFFSGLFKSIGHIISGVGKAISNALKNDVIRTIAAIAVGVVMGPGGSWALFGGNAFANTLAAGFVSGLIAGRGDLGVALQSAVTAGAFYGVGHGGLGLEDGSIGKIIGHAAVGCASAMMGGGSCQSGAIAAGVTQAFSGKIGDISDRTFRTVAASLVGGTASVLGGGKFENGAITGAFSRLFNDEAGLKSNENASPGIQLTSSQYIDANSLQASMNMPMLDFGGQPGRVYIEGWLNVSTEIGLTVGSGSIFEGISRFAKFGSVYDYVRWGPTQVSNQLIDGPGAVGSSKIFAIKGGGTNPETGFTLPFHYHIHEYNWYKPWTWLDQTPIIRPVKK